MNNCTNQIHSLCPLERNAQGVQRTACRALLSTPQGVSKAQVLLPGAQSCPTPSDPMDYSLPGSSIHGIFQARVLEWGAIAVAPPTWLVSNFLV